MLLIFLAKVYLQNYKIIIFFLEITSYSWCKTGCFLVKTILSDNKTPSLTTILKANKVIKLVSRFKKKNITKKLGNAMKHYFVNSK